MDLNVLGDEKRKTKKKFRNKHLDHEKLQVGKKSVTNSISLKKSKEKKQKRKIRPKKSVLTDSLDRIKNLETTNSLKTKTKNEVKKNSASFKKIRTPYSNESDSEGDQEIRNELKSLLIFKNIQKLISDDPSLMSASDTVEEESFEKESVKRGRESELEDLSMESEDDGSCDDTGKESEMFPKDIIYSSNKNTKEKLVSGKDFVRTPKESRANKATTTKDTTSGFERTQKDSLSNRDGKVESKKGTTTLRNKALEKLQGAKFRYLNEKLYTESGKDSYNYFQENEDEYMDYHRGYSLQVAKWPLNPVDKIISSLQKMKKNMTIADMGCGDAKIARTLSKCIVHSFDLVALNDFVTPCDISKVPLSSESVDVVIFCLSLMGTNLKEYLQEAYRIAKLGGILKIAEVESRIPNLDQFIISIQSLGFSLVKKDVEHKLFVFLEFKKMKKKKNGSKVQNITLKPCLYKKR